VTVANWSLTGLTAMFGHIKVPVLAHDDEHQEAFADGLTPRKMMSLADYIRLSNQEPAPLRMRGTSACTMTPQSWAETSRDSISAEILVAPRAGAECVGEHQSVGRFRR
jgi:hypothetical protein